MVLLQEITEKKKMLMEKSSVLEQLLYALLSGHKANLPIQESNLNNIEKIALLLLKGDRTKAKPLIQKEQKADNSFQFHYSRNLVELTVMTLADENFEKANVQHFLKNKGLKEAFVLSHTYKEVELTKQTVSESKIDKLIHQIIVKKETTNFTKTFTDALQEADELIEIFILEKSYECLIDFHPVPNTKIKIELLLSAIEKYNDRIELKIKRQFFVWAFVILFSLGGIIVYVIPTYWSKYDFGKLTTVSSYLFPILFFLLALYFFLFHKIEGKFSLVTKYIEKKKQKINKKYGIELEKIEKIKKNLDE